MLRALFLQREGGGRWSLKHHPHCGLASNFPLRTATLRCCDIQGIWFTSHKPKWKCIKMRRLCRVHKHAHKNQVANLLFSAQPWKNRPTTVVKKKKSPERKLCDKKYDDSNYMNTLLTDLVLLMPKTLNWPSEGRCCKVFMTDTMCSTICGEKWHKWHMRICSFICLIPECAAVLESSRCSDTPTFESFI